jgi:hypothetical protein
MARAVELYFDPVADQAVRTLWQAIAAAGPSTSLLEGGYRPTCR